MMKAHRSPQPIVLVAVLAVAAIVGVVMAVWALSPQGVEGPRPRVAPGYRCEGDPENAPMRAKPCPPVLHESDDPTSPTVPPEVAATMPKPATTAAPLPTQATAPSTSAPLAKVFSRPSDVAFCGPSYDASPTEWQALAETGVRLAYPPCSSYPFGQPVPWPVYDGSVRYMGFIPWNDPDVPHGLFEQYLHNAAAVGISVMGFAPEVWATPDPGAVLDQLPRTTNLVGWAIPEEPDAVDKVTALYPITDAMHERGMFVHVNFTSTYTREIGEAAKRLYPDLVSSDDYSSISAALLLDRKVAIDFGGIPRLMAVSTVQYDCHLPAPTLDERAQWVQAAHEAGAGIYWFTWRLPKLDQFCDGQNAGTPWTGGLWDAATDQRLP